MTDKVYHYCESFVPPPPQKSDYGKLEKEEKTFKFIGI